MCYVFRDKLLLKLLLFREMVAAVHHNVQGYYGTMMFIINVK